jgi:hypothetical protein
LLLSKFLLKRSIKSYRIEKEREMALLYFKFAIFSCQQVKNVQMDNESVLSDEVVLNLSQSDVEYKEFTV